MNLRIYIFFINSNNLFFKKKINLLLFYVYFKTNLKIKTNNEQLS